MALLEVTDLGISFGGLRAVDELNMRIEKGALVGLIGPNGAGKTILRLLQHILVVKEGTKNGNAGSERLECLLWFDPCAA